MGIVMSKNKILLIILALFLSVAGCANYTYRQGQVQLDRGQYLAAIAKFKEYEDQHPDDFKVKRGMGIAYFRLEDYDKAVRELRQAQQLKPEDGNTKLYLGMVYERKGFIDSALIEYRDFNRLGRFSSVKGKIKARITFINQTKIALDVKNTIKAEKEINPMTFPANTVGVLYFKNVSANEALAPLLKGLVEILTVDLSKVNSLQVVERLKLQKLRDELALGRSEMFDQATVPRYGKLLGASTIVMGAFTISSDTGVQILAMPVNTITGEFVGGNAQVDGLLTNFFDLEKDLVFQIIKQMGIVLSFEEEEAISKSPTRNMQAFLAYCRGLDLADKGLMDQAKTEYANAFSLDPGFDVAKDRHEEIEIGETIDMTDVSQFEELIIEEITPTGVGDATRDRLMVTGEKVGSEVLPTETTNLTTRRPEEILSSKIIVKGKLPPNIEIR